MVAAIATAVCVVQGKQRLRKLVQLLEVACMDPVGPRDPQVRDICVEGGQGHTATTRREVGPQPACLVGVVGRVREPGP